MNTLMEALRRTEEAGPPPVGCGGDHPFGPEALGEPCLAPLRATGNDIDPGPAPSMTSGGDESSVPGAWRLDPGRVAGGGAAPDAVPGADAGGRFSPRPPPEGLDAEGASSTTHPFLDPRMTPRRRGVGRVLGITLSLLTAIGAGAAGGYSLWKAQLVRPALVRHLSRMPALVADLAPVHAASAATGGETGSVAEAPVRRRRDPAVPATGSAEASPAPALEPHARTGLDPLAGTAGGPAAETEGFGGESRPEPRPEPRPVIEIRKGIRDDRVAASLERAYGAFRAGDLESAAEAYRAVVRHEPGNRDALLGLAAVATRAGGWDEAAGHYARVLAFHPADTVAQAALIAVGGQDSARGESRLKALLWREPEAAHLHFDLGNVYAAQSRWPEARQSFFSAYRFDRENADYAYNLAVSLDHLSRRESALHYYREALALARSRPSSFDATAVLARIHEVGASAGEDAAPLRSSSEPAGADPVAGSR